MSALLSVHGSTTVLGITTALYVTVGLTTLTTTSQQSIVLGFLSLVLHTDLFFRGIVLKVQNLTPLISSSLVIVN